MFEDFVVIARCLLLMLAPAVAGLGFVTLAMAVLEDKGAARVGAAAVFAVACAFAGYAWFCLIS